MAKQPSHKFNFNSKNQGLRTHPAMQEDTTVKKVFMSINATNNHVATADHELENYNLPASLSLSHLPCSVGWTSSKLNMAS